MSRDVPSLAVLIIQASFSFLKVTDSAQLHLNFPSARFSAQGEWLLTQQSRPLCPSRSLSWPLPLQFTFPPRPWIYVTK